MKIRKKKKKIKNAICLEKVQGCSLPKKYFSVGNTLKKQTLSAAYTA